VTKKGIPMGKGRQQKKKKSQQITNRQYFKQEGLVGGQQRGKGQKGSEVNITAEKKTIGKKMGRSGLGKNGGAETVYRPKRGSGSTGSGRKKKGLQRFAFFYQKTKSGRGGNAPRVGKNKLRLQLQLGPMQKSQRLSGMTEDPKKQNTQVRRINRLCPQ